MIKCPRLLRDTYLRLVTDRFLGILHGRLKEKREGDWKNTVPSSSCPFMQSRSLARLAPNIGARECAHIAPLEHVWVEHVPECQ